MLESLQSALANNQLVSGGVVLAALGLAAMWLRELPVKVAGWARHFVVTTLTADSRDELMFPALIEYMDSREALRRINNFTVRAVRQQRLDVPEPARRAAAGWAAGAAVLAGRGLPRVRARRPADVDEARGPGRREHRREDHACRPSAATRRRWRRSSTRQ